MNCTNIANLLQIHCKNIAKDIANILQTNIAKTQQQLKGIAIELVRAKIEAYYRYFWIRNQDAGRINAPIILIKSPVDNLLSITQNQEQEVLLSSDWKSYTRQSYLAYPGFGTHQTMMDPPNIEKNSTYIALALKNAFIH